MALGNYVAFFIAISACLITDLLGIKSNWAKLLMGGDGCISGCGRHISLYVYSCSLFFGLLFMVVSVWMIERVRYGLAGGIILFSFGLGIYQAYLEIWLGLAVCVLMRKCLEKETLFRDLIKYVLKYIGVSIAGLFLYLICSKVFLTILSIAPTSYQGFDELGTLNILKIFQGAWNGWRTYFSMAFRDVQGLTNSAIIRVSIIICLGISFYYFVKNSRKFIYDMKKLGIAVLLFIFFPICVNIMYAICVMDNSMIYTLMMYPAVMIFIFPIFLKEQFSNSSKGEGGKKFWLWP